MALAVLALVVAGALVAALGGLDSDDAHDGQRRPRRDSIAGRKRLRFDRGP